MGYTFTTATTITSTTGALDNQHGINFYQFSLTSTSRVIFGAADSGGLELYDASQSLLRSSSQTIDETLAPGSYYLKAKVAQENAIFWEGYGQEIVWYMGNNPQATTYNDYTMLAQTGNPIATIADMNGDGIEDLIRQGPEIWEVTSYKSQSFNPIALPQAPGWTVEGVADWNGDGSLDLTWRNYSTGDNAIWLMDGYSIASGVILQNVGPEWEMIGVEDWNGDGQPDLYWREPISGTDGLWIMNGYSAVDSVIFNPVPAEWRMEGLCDWDSDGQRDDWMWKNYATGDVAFWLMNGTVIESAFIGFNVGGEWKPTPFKAAKDFNLQWSIESVLPPLPMVAIAASDPSAGEPSNPGQWTVTRTGDTSQALTIAYSVNGTATSGQDYAALLGTVTIAAGATSANINLTVIDDSEIEGDETVTLTLAPGSNYSLGTSTATVTIADDDYDPPIPTGDAGNTIATAKDLGIVRSFIKTTTDSVGPTDKKDYFKVTMTQPGTLHASITGITADIDVELLRSDGNLIDFSDNSGARAEEISRAIPAGIYYLFIYPYGNVSSGYTLNIWCS